jgi:hypothetical protein
VENENVVIFAVDFWKTDWILRDAGLDFLK